MSAVTEAWMVDAVQRREEKARVIAAYAWRLGLDVDALQGLPYADRHRKTPTLRRFAAEAYRAAGVVLNPPSSPDSPTWMLVADKLTAMATEAATGEQGWTVPAQDLVGQADQWKAPGGPTHTDEGPPPATSPPANPQGLLAVSDAPPTVDAALLGVADPSWPPGWAVVAAFPPLEEGACIHHPDRKPVVVTVDGGRCGDCPPRPDEITAYWEETDGRGDLVASGVHTRHGWGALVDGRRWRVDWSRTGMCVRPVRCYCGRPCRGETGPSATETTPDADASV